MIPNKKSVKKDPNGTLKGSGGVHGKPGDSKTRDLPDPVKYKTMLWGGVDDVGMKRFWMFG